MGPKKNNVSMAIGKKVNQKYRTHDLFYEKPDKLIIVHRTFKNVESNVAITSKCREDRESLAMNEEILTNTSLANFCPS